MAQVEVINVFEAQFQSQKEFTYTPKDGSPAIKFPEMPERSAVCALVELKDGSGCRVNVELPEFKKVKDVKKGDVLSIECKNLTLLDRYWIVRNVTRFIPSAGK